jgi:hypothetical protein
MFDFLFVGFVTGCRDFDVTLQATGEHLCPRVRAWALGRNGVSDCIAKPRDQHVLTCFPKEQIAFRQIRCP